MKKSTQEEMTLMKYDESTRFYSTDDENQDLWLLLTHARYAVFRAREKELQRYGLSPEQASLMFVVMGMGNKATPAALSRYLLRQPHTVSALVDRMAKKGLIKKVKDLERKNLVRVVITEKGQHAYELTTKRGPIHRIMNTLNKEEKEQFRNQLEKIFAQARKEIGLDLDKLPSSEY
jgi:MarR family transcriptional regulator, organic hydroperoxide resistance regulator